MGILLAALAGAGDSGVESINQNIKQDNAKDLEAQRVDLETQKAKALEDYKNTVADQQRMQLQSRVGQTDDQKNANMLINAQRSSAYDWVPDGTKLNPDGTAPDGTPTIKPTMDDLDDDDKAKYKSTPRQILSDMMANAAKTGDYKTMEDVAKIAEASKINTGYGSTTTDPLDVDPETGRPNTIVDNTTGAQAIRQQIADAQSDKADAAVTHADAYANRQDTLENAAKNGDKAAKVMADASKQAQVHYDNLLKLQGTLSPKQQEAMLPQIAEAKEAYDKQYGKLTTYLESNNPVGGATGTSPAAAAAAAPADKPILSRVQSAPPADKYVVGKTYRDAKGNTATYAGNGKWK